jgi:hypothetical protein
VKGVVMSKCYIVQEPIKRAGEGMVNMMDFRPVLEYGEPVVCLPCGPIALSPAPTIAKLNEVLKDFSDDDYLVAAGDPSAIAMAGAIACSNNRGRFKILKWDKSQRRYIKVEVNIFPHRKERED